MVEKLTFDPLIVHNSSIGSSNNDKEVTCLCRHMLISCGGGCLLLSYIFLMTGFYPSANVDCGTGSIGSGGEREGDNSHHSIHLRD